MKYILLFTLFYCGSYRAESQFHVRVECNPGNDGKVNPAWLNNYVIAYTTNNWINKFYIFTQNDYSGYDDNGIEYFSSYYEIWSFKELQSAVKSAKAFRSVNYVGDWLSRKYLQHLKKNIWYEADNKKLCFGCKEKSKDVQCQQIQVY